MEIEDLINLKEEKTLIIKIITIIEINLMNKIFKLCPGPSD